MIYLITAGSSISDIIVWFVVSCDDVHIYMCIYILTICTIRNKFSMETVLIAF